VAHVRPGLPLALLGPSLRPPPATDPSRSPASRRTARALAVAALLVFAFTGGGRIVGSDELAMFELSRGLLRGDLAVPEGATLEGLDGRHYTKGAAAQALLALPLTAAGTFGARALGLPAARADLAARFVASFFNAAVTALLLALLYLAARGLGVGPRAAFAAALMAGFTTPLWVYAKSFMAEPLQAVGLLLALEGAARANESEGARGRCGLGIFIAVSVKLSMLPLALAAAAPIVLAGVRALGRPALGLFAALAGHAVYNALRFGTPLETGYGAQATAAAYTTPIAVGLYGLLFSSGKGVAWFAPGVWLVPIGVRAMLGRWLAPAHGVVSRILALAFAPPAARAAVGAALAWVAGLALYARFQHWAGDGSYGPRYLVPLLPLAFVPVAFALEHASRWRRALAWALALAGLLVQIGGVAIYFGAQMREAGDYPYTLPLDHPRFMYESHFVPAASPIGGHWRMLVRNAGEHVRGGAPRIGPPADTAGAPDAERDARTGLTEADQRALLRALDFWWTYLVYAGFPVGPVAAAATLLAVLALLALGRALAALRAERAAT
jgi:hypothetical protein